MTPAFRDWIEKARAVGVGSILQQRHIELPGRHGKLAGPCPLCGGTDRFGVDVERGLFNCRGCGGKGQGAISFVQFLDSVPFLMAVEKITGEPPPKDEAKAKPKRPSRGRFVCSYSYCDEVGTELYQVLRFVEPKGFAQRQPGPGGWVNNLRGVRLVPYRLPDLMEALATETPVCIFEGEKDCDNAAKLGIAATTTAMGVAGKSHWQSGAYDDFFHGADVVLVPDQDAELHKGFALASAMFARLSPIAGRVRLVDLPNKDFSDWIAAGGTREAFDAMVEIAPDFKGPTQEPPQDDEPPPWSNGHDTEPLPVIEFLSKAEFLAGFVPPDYLIDGMLQRRFVYAMTGQTGHAKTAIALLIAELISSAEYAMLGNHPVEKGRVVYFVGENPDDVRQRVIGADSARKDDPLKDTITFIPGVFNIPQMYSTLVTNCQAIGGVDLVIIDTSAAYFLTDDEQSNTQMGNHARMLRKLTELPGGPCVLVLCHPIKHVIEPSQLLPRGGGAFLNEMDGNLTAWKRDDMIELYYNKMRGGGFEPMSFKTEMIKTDKLVDRKGRQIPTVRALAISRSEEETREALTTEEEDRVLVALLENPNASFSAIAEHCKWINDKHEPLKARVQRIVTRLEKCKPAQVRKNRNKYELTDSGKENARKAMLRFTVERDEEEMQSAPRMFS